MSFLCEQISFAITAMFCDDLILGAIYTEDRLIISQDQPSFFGITSQHEHTWPEAKMSVVIY
jgi:hypothetical protein